MSDDWRFDGETGADAGDYFLGQRKRVDIDKRRPVIRRASDLVGPGINAQAVRITNWSDTLATFNGYFSSLPGALFAPDSVQNFVGVVVMDSEMGGTQTLTGMADGTTYKRMFLRNPGDSESITFGGWSVQKTLQSGSSVVPMFQTGRVEFPMPFRSLPVVTLTGGNGESLSFVYGSAGQPDVNGFGFFAHTPAGVAITSGDVRVNWIALA